MRLVGAAVAFASIATAFSPPAYSYDGDRSGKDVTTTTKASSSASSNKASGGPISFEATRSTPRACRAKSATVYETAYGAKADPTAAGSKASPSAKVGKPFGYNEEQFRHNPEGHMKLKSCNHWSHNANDPKNIVPTTVGEKTQIYYAEDGSPHPSKTFYFGVLDLHFKAPAVVLEQSAYIINSAYSSNQLVIDFNSAVACDFAKTSWKKGTIIVSSSAECKETSEDDQCYFEIEDLVKSDDGKSIIVKGKPQSQSECTEGGEANWGMYRPSVSNGGNVVNQPGKNGTSTGPPNYPGTTGPDGGSGSGAGPGGSNGTIGGGSPSTNFTDNGTSNFGDELSTCRAPVDTKYNLPTACVGEYFDLDLDEALGYGQLSADDLSFLKEAMAGLDDETLTKVTRSAVLHRRNIDRRLLGRFLRFVGNKIIAPAVSALKTAVNVATTVVTGVVQLVTTGTISGSIRESFSFALPNGATADAKQVDSPWGAAILIAAYGTAAQSAPTNGLQKDGYLNIFCVGCGAQGRVELAGRATWSVTQGITQGELEAWADLKAALKIGVDAQIQLSREWNKNLFQVGLPGLSFGVITIGPQVRLDSRVTLEAQAKGRLLAGAELSWNRAYAKIDMVTPANSIRQNFDPVFHPTFEAEGSISVGAELGLPIGFEFGISVASWKKTVALINEPMIKGIAKAAASAELSNGQFTAGFTSTEGCIGIYSNLSWRNRLYGDVLGIRQFDIMDTGYKSIKSACIPIGPQDQTPAIGNGQTSSQSSIQPAASQAPTNNDDEPSSVTPNAPQTSSNGDATPDTQLPPAVSSEGVATPQASAQPDGNDDVQPPAPVTPPADGETVADKRSVYRRQSNSTNLPADNNPTEPAGLRDLTDSIKDATNVVTYSIADVPTVAYAREDGYEFTKILAEQGEYNLFYCSNGNMYVKKTAQTAGLGCDELFVYSNNAVAGDGAGRYLYFHTNTMEAAGVSRLRLGDEEAPVKGTSALALVAWNSTEVGAEPDADIEGLYFAADYDTQAFFWLTFCSYKDGQPPKVFVVEDIEKGVAVLESGDVKFSVTGGDVDKCFALSAKEDSASLNTWSQFDDSETTTPDGLEYIL